VRDEGQPVDISQILVSEEVRQIRRERWSGILALAQGEVAKGLYFIDGDTVFAASTVEEDRLGANLYRIGRITEAQFRTAMAEAQAPGRRLGQALIDAGVIRPAELAAAVIGQTERIVLSVLRWTNGRLQRRPMDRPLPPDLILHLSTPRLLVLGARLFPNPRLLEPVLGRPGVRLRRAFPAPFEYDQLPTSPPERAVLALCAREKTLAEVLRLPHPRPQLLRAIYGLVAGGLLETLEPVAVEVPLPVSVPLAEPSPPTNPSLSDYTPLDDAGPPARSPGQPEVPSNPEIGEQKARSMLERGQREAAVELLRQLVERFPEARGCRRLLAMTESQSDFRKEVERHFLKALEGDPDDVELRHRLATYYRRSGMSGRAMTQLRLVLSVDPGHAGAWRDLGELEAGEGRRGR